jgi:hypothetical protein
MKKVYTAFSFNGTVYTDLINASLDNSMHSEDMRGNRTLLKEKIPGRDIPYFYAVEDEALEFDVVFALTTPKTKAELKVIMRELITQTGYKELHFGDIVSGTYTRKSPIYKVIFDGESKLDFVGANVYNEGVATLKYFGYFTLKACADRPYGYENLTGTISASLTGTATLNNPGDLPVFPNITITNAAQNTYNTTPIRIFNDDNSTSVAFNSLASGEVITINADLKTISSDTPGVYDRWQRNDLKLDIGNNAILLQRYDAPNWVTITTNPWTSVVFTVQVPTFIKE